MPPTARFVTSILTLMCLLYTYIFYVYEGTVTVNSSSTRVAGAFGSHDTVICCCHTVFERILLLLLSRK